MAQFIRPDSNVTQTGFTGGFADIDETSANDVDFAWCANATEGVLEVGLSNPSTIGSATATIRYRIAKTNAGTVDGTGGSVGVTAHLYQGASLVASDTARTATGTWTTYSFSPSMATVTDWNDLRLRFTVKPNSARAAGISWAELETTRGYSDTISESSTPGDSLTNTATFVVAFTETATPAVELGSTSSANIHAFTRLPFGEIWFVIPIGGSASHNYYTFCIEESQRAEMPVWFKGTIDASAVLDDALLGTDTSWSCLRIADSTSAALYSFDKRLGGTGQVSWNLTSSAFYVDEAERRVLIKRYYKDFERQDGSVTMQILTYDYPAGNNIAAPSLTVATGDTTKDFRVSGRLMKMKFSGSERWRLGKPAFDVVEMGER